MGIFEKRFDKKPDPRISFFETNLLFLPLQIYMLILTYIYYFFVMKTLTFKSLVSFLHFKQYIICNYISFFKKLLFSNCNKKLL